MAPPDVHLRAAVVTSVAERLVFGCQEPRVSSVPPYSVSLGDDAIAFAAKAGLFLDPWQQLVLRDALGVLPGGLWSAPRVGLLCPRQNGKGSILEALELFHMFVLRTPLIVHSAHKFDTSQEHFLRMRVLIEGNPDLARHLASTPTANGKEAIILRNGNRLKFKARTISGAGRGFSADLVILDEAMLLPEQALDAMMPTLTARKNPQVWFTSSAGTPDSAALWRIVKRGRERAPRLAYFEWGCEAGADMADRANWVLANPGLGYRLSMEALEDDYALLSEEGFAREHGGVWDDTAADAGLNHERWRSLSDPSAERGASPVFALSTAPDRSWAALTVAWRRVDGDVQVMLADYRPTTAWVKARAKELGARWGGRVVTDRESQDLLDDPETVPLARAEATLDDAITAGTVRHSCATPELMRALDTAVRGAKWRPSGDGRVLDRKGTLDISPVVAAALAVHQVMTNNAAPQIHEWPSDDEVAEWEDEPL